MIPIILGALALGSAVLGVGAGAAGVADMNEAKEIGDRAQQRYETAVNQLKADWEAVNKSAEVYGQIQLRVKQGTITRFVAFIERIGQRASQSDMSFLAGLDITTQQIKEYKTAAVEAQEWVKGGVSAAIAGAAAGSGAITLARSVGTATVTRFFGLWATEVGISQLGGAAAWNATLAWLGGSSMAVGGAVLGGVTLGPALMVGGFQLAGKGEEALTKAREYEAKVNTEIANIEAAKDFLQQVRRRITELSSLVEDLNTRAVLSLNELESKPFDRDRDASKFQEVALLVKALAEIMKTPVLDNEGQLNPASRTIQAKYRTLGGN
jgi:hypothetical protein